LPGTLEFLALLGDITGAAAVDEASGDGDAADCNSLLAPWLPCGVRTRYRAWLSQFAARSGDAPLSEVWAWILRSGWAWSLFADPVPRRRVIALLADVPVMTPEKFVDRPLWRAWRDAVLHWRGRGDEPDRPLALLTSTDRPGGGLHTDAAYLCAGNEPPAEHARVLSRVTDRVLVLFHDRSPLPGADVTTRY
jgi:hypothetical protein